MALVFCAAMWGWASVVSDADDVHAPPTPQKPLLLLPNDWIESAGRAISILDGQRDRSKPCADWNQNNDGAASVARLPMQLGTHFLCTKGLQALSPVLSITNSTGNRRLLLLLLHAQDVWTSLVPVASNAVILRNPAWQGSMPHACAVFGTVEYGTASFSVAPVLVLHYALCRAFGPSAPSMLDVTASMLVEWAAEDMARFLVTGAGTPSITYFVHLLGRQGELLTLVAEHATDKAVEALLLVHGPALVR